VAIFHQRPVKRDSHYCSWGLFAVAFGFSDVAKYFCVLGITICPWDSKSITVRASILSFAFTLASSDFDSSTESWCPAPVHWRWEPVRWISARQRAEADLRARFAAKELL
jgi:hypothetical protein